MDTQTIVISVSIGVISGSISFLSSLFVYKNRKRDIEHQSLKSNNEIIIKSKQLYITVYKEEINILADTMAKYQSLAFSRGLSSYFNIDKEEFDSKDLGELLYLGNKIQLMLRRKSSVYNELNNLISEITNSVNKKNMHLDISYYGELDDRYIEVCQKYIDEEWNRLYNSFTNITRLRDIRR